MAVEQEVVIEFNKLLSEHIADLWKIAGGLVGMQILIVAHPWSLTKCPFANLPWL